MSKGLVKVGRPVVWSPALSQPGLAPDPDPDRRVSARHVGSRISDFCEPRSGLFVRILYGLRLSLVFKCQTNFINFKCYPEL